VKHWLALASVALVAGGPVVLAAQAAVPFPIPITLSVADQPKYRDFAEGKDFKKAFSYRSSDFDSSPVLETVLIRRALVLGGLRPNFVFVDIPNTERERTLVRDGEVVVAGTSQWDFFCDENAAVLYKSAVIIPDGAFEKGLYTTKEKAATLRVRSVGDLAALTVCSSSNWRVDWKTLSALGFRSLENVASIPSMFKMVHSDRGDVTVQSFSGNPDLSVTSEGITLYPVPGVKLLLQGTRHFVVSKRHPSGKLVFDALQKGLAVMAKEGEIRRALVESGFFNAAVRNWKALAVQKP
jgi:hypothetical protein